MLDLSNFNTKTQKVHKSVDFFMFLKKLLSKIAKFFKKSGIFTIFWRDYGIDENRYGCN